MSERPDNAQDDSALTLRDRIAAALYVRIRERSPWAPEWPDVREEVREAWLADADRVIAELGLRAERGQRSNPTGPLWGSGNRHTVTRWVTDWERDE